MMAPKKDNKQSSRERARPPTPTDDQYDEEIPDAISAISTLIREARKTIGNMNISGRNKGIKTTLIEKLSNALLRCSKLKAKVDINNDQRIVEGTGTRPRLQGHDMEERFGKLEKDMAEIKGNMGEMKELILGATKTYAQATTTNTATETNNKTAASKPRSFRNQITKEQQRAARQPYEVRLSNQHMPETTKKKLVETHIKGIIRAL
jgi:hypothetical protein